MTLITLVCDVCMYIELYIKNNTWFKYIERKIMFAVFWHLLLNETGCVYTGINVML